MLEPRFFAGLHVEHRQRRIRLADLLPHRARDRRRARRRPRESSGPVFRAGSYGYDRNAYGDGLSSRTLNSRKSLTMPITVIHWFCSSSSSRKRWPITSVRFGHSRFANTPLTIATPDRALPFGVGEVATGEQRHVQRLEHVRRDAEVRERRLLPGLHRHTFGNDAAPRSRRCSNGTMFDAEAGDDARQRLDAAHDVVHAAEPSRRAASY